MSWLPPLIIAFAGLALAAAQFARSQRVRWLAYVVLLLLLLGTAFAVSWGPGGPEVNRSERFATNEGGQILCYLAAATPDRCGSHHPLVGHMLSAIGDEVGVDTDGDSLNEWTCGEPSSEIPGSVLVDIVAVGDPAGMGTTVSVYSCLERAAAGPASDSFLLTDRHTVVERIDLDGDGRADLIKVGDEESKPIPRGVPWWQTLIAPGVLAAIVAGVFAVVTNRLDAGRKKYEAATSGGASSS